MATVRMIDSFEAEATARPKQLTIRERHVVRNMLADAVNTEASLTINHQIADYLKLRDCEFQRCNITQNDHNWLKVDVHIGEWKGIETMTKRTKYEFKQRHPNNPSPINHDLPRRY